MDKFDDMALELMQHRYGTADPAWRRQPRPCDGRMSLFYDQENEPTAKAICRGCPARRPCLLATLAAEELEFITGTEQVQRHGVAGGLTAAQRDEFVQLHALFNPKIGQHIAFAAQKKRGRHPREIADDAGCSVRTVYRRLEIEPPED